mmetsp:Transcript_30225/g.64023  ORF Transcript_30225/g.64023 Transcript_30225/m.64023 type:complete len:268 (+) Transcript_30225:532-1335(+)
MRAAKNCGDLAWSVTWIKFKLPTNNISESEDLELSNERLETICRLLIATCALPFDVDIVTYFKLDQPLNIGKIIHILGFAALSPRATAAHKESHHVFPASEFTHLDNSLHHLLRSPAYRTITGMPPLISKLSVTVPTVSSTTEFLTFVIEGLPLALILNNNFDDVLTFRWIAIDMPAELSQLPSPDNDFPPPTASIASCTSSNFVSPKTTSSASPSAKTRPPQSTFKMLWPKSQSPTNSHSTSVVENWPFTSIMSAWMIARPSTNPS